MKKIPKNWTREQTLAKLKQAHEQENEFNKELSGIDSLIKFKLERKRQLANKISKNMTYRNKLISML